MFVKLLASLGDSLADGHCCWLLADKASPEGDLSVL